MSDLNRFWKHLEQAQAERHTQGHRGSYRIDPATNKIVFVHDTRKGIEVRKDRKEKQHGHAAHAGRRGAGTQ